jgi:glycosyltransferase involved in cell wall biosynthesis
LPNAVLEAMATRRAVVATAVGGVPELVEDGENGLLVPPRRPAALARAILELLADPERRERLGLAGEALSRRLAPQAVVAATEAVYDDCLASRRRVRSSDDPSAR